MLFSFIRLLFLCFSSAAAHQDQSQLIAATTCTHDDSGSGTQVSLLQTSYYVSHGESYRQPSEEDAEYSFLPAADQPVQSMNWNGNHPHKQSTYTRGSDMDPLPLDERFEMAESLDDRMRFDLAAVQAAAHANEAPDVLLPPHEVTALYAGQEAVRFDPSIQSMSWQAILAMSLAACFVLGMLVYVLYPSSAESKESKDADSQLSSAPQQTAADFRKKLFKNPCCGSPGVSAGVQQLSEDIEKENEFEVSDIREVEPIDLDSDTFGMTVCSLTRDCYFLSVEGASLARILRILTSLLLVCFTLALQIFLVLKIKEFVTAEAVSGIRDAYDKYELAIYGKENTTLTVNGKHRGATAMPPLAEAMKRLQTLSDDDQDAVCHIPLSQPNFFGALLLIWTLICFNELRKAFALQQSIIMLETVSTMRESMRQGNDETTDTDGVIQGMTCSLKLLITVVMFVPRVLTTVLVMWIGGRWLLATTDFGNLVSNAVALEFILLIKDGLYAALAPFRTQLDLAATKIDPYPKNIRPSWFSFISSALIFVTAVLTVYMYMHHWQTVLPGYRWDVHAVCAEYMANIR